MSAPFGIPLYSPIERLTVIYDHGHGNYIVEVPTPHPMFNTYAVRATRSIGVAWVKGLGADIENDTFGTATQALVDRLADQLAQKYGAPEKNDFLMTGSIWTEPQDWTNGIVSHERQYSCTWMRPRAPRLPDDLEHIFVGATSENGYNATVVIEYASQKLAEADAEIERQLADIL